MVFPARPVCPARWPFPCTQAVQILSPLGTGFVPLGYTAMYPLGTRLFISAALNYLSQLPRAAVAVAARGSLAVNSAGVVAGRAHARRRALVPVYSDVVLLGVGSESTADCGLGATADCRPCPS